MLYADYNATAPMPGQVAEKMGPYLKSEFGNPSSTQYAPGRRAREAVEQARAEVAALVDAEPDEVVLLSGGTEASAHALLGGFLARPDKRHALISAVEHPAVVEGCRLAERTLGAAWDCVPVSGTGALDFNCLYSMLRVETGILSFMLANNETGIMFPIAEAAAFGRERGLLVHTDAVQAVGKAIVSFRELGVDLLSLSAHKFGGPKGAGALIVRRGCAWEPVIKGGGQESGRRGGTEAVALIVGMGEAARLRREQLRQGVIERVSALRDQFERRVLSGLPGQGSVNGAGQARLYNTSSLCLRIAAGADAVSFLAQEKEIFISAGSACKSGSAKPSSVLSAMGLSQAESMTTIRVSFGPEVAEAEVEAAAAAVIEAVEACTGASCCRGEDEQCA